MTWKSGLSIALWMAPAGLLTWGAYTSWRPGNAQSGWVGFELGVAVLFAVVALAPLIWIGFSAPRRLTLQSDGVVLRFGLGGWLRGRREFYLPWQSITEFAPSSGRLIAGQRYGGYWEFPDQVSFTIYHPSAPLKRSRYEDAYTGSIYVGPEARKRLEAARATWEQSLG